MTAGPIDEYLRELEGALRERGCHDPRIVEEAREHLADAAEDGVRRGLVREDAEREAVERFGPAPLIAAQARPGRSRMMMRLTTATATLAGHWRWITAATAAAGLLTSAASYYWLPTRYRSETLIVLSRPGLPGDTDASRSQSLARLQTISRVVLSRPRLEWLARDFGLDKGADGVAPITEAVQQMRRNISIEIGQPSQFTVAFQSPDPRLAMRVTERIASLFVEENFRRAEAVAAGSNEFFDAEIADVRRRLTEEEEKLNARRAAKLPVTRADAMLFEVLEERYRGLLAKREDVRSTAALERRALGDQYQVVEAARVPDQPVGPSRASVNVAGTLAGLTLAVAATLVRRREPRAS